MLLVDDPSNAANSGCEIGGYPKFIERGFNDNYLPVWLQEAGYDTYYLGKLFNALAVSNYNAPFVKGFNFSDILLDPYTYDYLNATYQRNQDEPISYEGRHTSDVFAEKTYEFLEDAIARSSGDRPFFFGVAPIAPHSNMMTRSGKHMITAPIPLDRHAELFRGVEVPRTENFNPDKVSKQP